MRIISGNFRGKKINAPTHLPVRPTTDFAKEALFNVLNNRYYFDEISVLDLFAGIGSISYEFVSRGAQRVVSIDADAGCVKFIAETFKELKAEDISSVIRSDVYQFLSRNVQGSFDVVFADPPFTFEQEEYDKIIVLIQENNWLVEEGVLILEHGRDIEFEENQNLVETRKYGSVHFSFFQFLK